MNQNKPSKNENASALIAVIITIAVLSLLAGAFVSNVNNRRMTLSQGSTWQEALVGAEAGAHQGIAQLEQGVFQNSLPASTSSNTVTLSHSGEGSTTVNANYSLTRIYYTVNGIPSPGAPYYRIVSTGTVGLPGSKSLSMDSRDSVLRKLNLRTSARTATRTVEAWLAPVYSSTGSMGLRTDQSISLNNHNIFIDSFDSTILGRSYGGVLPGQPYPAGNQNSGMGYYNVAPYNYLAANISTNSDSLSGGNAYIYGDAYTNGGTLETVVGTGNLQGQLYDDYYEPMPPVNPPQWNVSSQGQIKTTKTLTGGTSASHAQYIVSSISLSGQKVLTFDFGKTGANPDPTKKYIDIYVTGDVSTKGGGSQTDGSIVIVNGVYVTMYVGGNMDMAGNGLVNNNGNAASLSIYGLTPPDGVSQTFSLGGSATFFGTVYAPGADLVLNGGGNGGQFVGSLAGKTASLKGNVQIRYDESLGLAATKMLTSFKTAAWFEDSYKKALLK
jgi:FlaG/FlaF family flagellin (archaellin)